MPYALETACTYVEGCVTFADRVRAEHGRKPTRDSPLARQLAQTRGRFHQHVQDAVSLAWLRLVTAEDHLSAMGNLVRQPTTMYSVHTLARTVAEVSARAWWLLDPDLDALDRAERGLAERLYALDEQGRLPSAEAKARSRARRQWLTERASAEGLSVHDDNQRPPATLLLRSLFDDEERIGVMLYRLLSAFTHGTSYALHRLVQRANDEPAEDGIARGITTTDAGQEAQVFLMAFLPYTRAIRRQMWLYGWPTDDLVAQLVYTSSELTRVMESVSK